jgi:hypothetical protein
MNPKLILILSQMSTHIIPCFFKIYFNIIIPSAPRFSKKYVLLKCYGEKFLLFFSLFHIYYISYPSSPWFYQCNNILKRVQIMTHLCSFFFTYRFQYPLCALFSDALNFCSSGTTRISLTYETTGNVLCISSITFVPLYIYIYIHFMRIIIIKSCFIIFNISFFLCKTRHGCKKVIPLCIVFDLY